MGETAKTIVLKGNPKKPESAEHIIIFPGGSIGVCRTTNNEYWAHIEVYHQSQEPELTDGIRESMHGEVIDSRIDYVYPNDPNIVTMQNMADIHHIAIRIKTKG